ncbi:unnamed protein product, partial [Rotaria sp. Silwood1]
EWDVIPESKAIPESDMSLELNAIPEWDGMDFGGGIDSGMCNIAE